MVENGRSIRDRKGLKKLDVIRKHVCSVTIKVVGNYVAEILSLMGKSFSKLKP